MNIPELVRNLDILLGYCISLVMGRLFRMTQISGSRIKIASHDIPTQPSTGEMIDGAETPCQVVRLLVRCRDSNSEPKVCRRGSHGRNNSERLVHRPLGTRYYGRVCILWPLVHIVCTLHKCFSLVIYHVWEQGLYRITYKHVCNEHAMEFAFFEKLCQLNPVFYIVEVPRLILGMSPQPWRLVTAARLHECVKNELLFRSSGGLARRRSHFCYGKFPRKKMLWL
jgi:hypothetical protein